jgi:uncharacterized membrane protein
MKKIKSILIIAAVFGAAQIFAQSSMEESVNSFGNSFESAATAETGSRGGLQRGPGGPGGGGTGGVGEPIGEGIAILSVLGAAYAGFKAKRNRKR